MNLEASRPEQLLKVCQHAFANARHREKVLGFLNQFGNLLRQCLDGGCGIAIGSDAERILGVDLEQIGGFVQNTGDGLVIQGKRKLYRCYGKAETSSAEAHHYRSQRERIIWTREKTSSQTRRHCLHSLAGRPFAPV